MRERTFNWDDPQALASAVRQVSGLDFLRGISEGKFPAPPVMQMLGADRPDVNDIQEGQVIFPFRPQEFHFNPIGSVHGGVYATMLDTVMACAVHTLLPAGTGYTTLDINIKYLRPLSLNGEGVKAIGKVISINKSTALAEGQIVDAEGQIYAHGTSTCMIFRPKGG
ncbi:PaaI family thioesterase [Deinococcus cellulosilyticus]|uniref:Phenylacetic acid degradation protein n=1 Tax=Deinococcus cellulosilyticus (strain DSM 18568 / NBRC 106333 / KACC 11606 / 5516J-15) TaxID=1223518 RepID=A0A511MWE4_DEIC1|nr:PaaI family thioesterase [Deinococcus cellulosilyticus]GEM44446.1 phenylacetic acid degradation protein [Deinococcus cellulosilyticus NBRC 106333 = KACC 11606]